MTQSIGPGIYEPGGVFLRYTLGQGRADVSIQQTNMLGCEDVNLAQPYADPGREVDVMWPRSQMGAQQSVTGGFLGGMDYMAQRWEWNWPATGRKRRKIVAGSVLDSGGAPVAGATVQLFNTSTGALVDTQVSKSDGTYETGDPNNTNCFAVGYNSSGPTEGTTVNNLTGT